MPLSEYETQRARNIERNNGLLVSLGLISKQEAAVSTARAFGRAVPKNPADRNKNKRKRLTECADSSI